MIESFTGLPGQGKTYHMTKKAYYYCLLKKKDVYANYKLDFGEKLNHRVHYFKELSELENVTNALILVDEAGIYLPSQAWKDIPFEFIRKIRQHRHDGLDLWYTAQDSQDVATYLRRITQFDRQFSRISRLCFEKVINPRTKAKIGFDISFLNKKIFTMYDTTENVDLADFVKNKLDSKNVKVKHKSMI